MLLPCITFKTHSMRHQVGRCGRMKPFLKKACRPFKVLARPFQCCFTRAEHPSPADVSQATATTPTMPPCPTDGAMLLPTALVAMPTISNHPTFPQGVVQGVIHLGNTDFAPLHPTSPEDPASLVTASVATVDGILLCGQAEGQQVMSQSTHDQGDSLVQKAAADAVDSIVHDLVEDALSHHDMATACAVDAVVEQLVGEAVLDAEAACRKEAAMAVDSVLTQLVSGAVAYDEAAQVEVVDTVLNELVSNVVVGVGAAQARSVFDLNTNRAVHTCLEQLISDDIVDAEAESAATCQPFTGESHVSEPGGSLSKQPSMHSTAGTHQVVGSHPSYSQHEAAVSSGGAARQLVQQLRREMELLNKNVNIGAYQEGWVDGKVKTLGQGPHWMTILSAPPNPSPSTLTPLLPGASTAAALHAALPSNDISSPCVLKLALVDRAENTVGTSRLLAQEVVIMNQCAHPNVLPLSFVGVQPSPHPCTPADLTRVVYIAFPWADISLEKRLGQEAWGRCTSKQGPRGVGGPAQGPSLSSLLEHGKAVLHALAHVHRSGVLHRGLTPDHLLLFSKQTTAAAARGSGGAGGPAPIKFHLKLGGFGGAVQLDDEGCTMDYPPYRCGLGYTPPEAQQGHPLTLAADVYQFGGLCYFMAVGSPPPTPLNHTTGMAESLLPGLMPEEWQALIAACWATKPEDRPTVSQLQHQICSLQQSLRGSCASTGHRSQRTVSSSHTGLMTRHEAAPPAAAGSAGRPGVLPKLLQGLDQWMPAPSIVHMPTASERPGLDGQSLRSMQSGNSAVVSSEAAKAGSIAAVHAGRLPPRRGDSASDDSWSWKAGFRNRSEAISAVLSKGMAEVSAKTAHMMQQLADTQLSAQHGPRLNAALV